MKLIGFNLNKINVEKLSESSKELKINTKIDIKGIDEIESQLFKEDESILKVSFVYSVEYIPKIGQIELGGDLLLTADKKIAKEIIDKWKDKKLSEEFRIILFNLILKKVNVKALELEEQLNLPLHIPMPSLKKGKKESK